MDGSDYRKKAAEMRERAAQVTDPVLCRELLTLAAEYERLAAAIERRREATQ